MDLSAGCAVLRGNWPLSRGSGLPAKLAANPVGQKVGRTRKAGELDRQSEAARGERRPPSP
jgi:hypothetical protein